MLLTKEQIAEKFGTSHGLASATLAANGVLPVDFGRGRSRGPRWYSAAVDAVIMKLHEEAQAKKKTYKPKVPRKTQTTVPLSLMSVADIYELTKPRTVQ